VRSSGARAVRAQRAQRIIAEGTGRHRRAPLAQTMWALALLLDGLLARPAAASQAVQPGRPRPAQAPEHAGGRLLRSEAAVGAGADVVVLLQPAQLQQAQRGPAARSSPSVLAPAQPAPTPAGAIAGSQTMSSPLAVFYHVFQKDDSEGANLTGSIVKEHMDVVKASAAFRAGLTLNYVFIGPIGSKVPELINCPTCHQLEHKQAGDEVVTLQYLFDHCKHNPSDRVLYMHSKGSFHKKPENDDFRRFLTKGAWSDACQNMPQECNACGSRFSPLPHQHFPGNMWVARCEYVSRLVEPSKMATAMQKVTMLSGGVGESGVPTSGQPLELDWDGQMSAWLGLGRFAMEHWLPSHPSHAPCDVYGGTDYIWAYDGIPTTWTPKLYKLPRPDLPLSHYCKHNGGPDQNLTKVKAWRLFEWQTLYPGAPRRSGPLWRYYEASAGGLCSAQPDQPSWH
ncbi:unnamed protein product, partial [Prorocentrum cordatum]